MKFNLYKYLLILLLWTALGAPAFSQANENLLLATRLMQEHRYEEALPVLKELNNKEAENYSYSTLLTDCLIQLKQYDEALKVARRFEEHPVYAGQAQIRIGELHHYKGEKEKASEIWLQNLENNPDRLQIYINTANVMVQRREYLQAVDVYKLARVNFNNERLFYGDIANAYMRAGEYELAIDEWLNLMESAPEQLPFIQRNLLRYNDPLLYDITIIELEERLDKLHFNNPVFEPFYQLQIWLLQENKLYRRALATAKAFEQATPSFSYSLFNLGRQLNSHNEFELATEAFSFYIENAEGEIKWRNMEELAATYSNWAKYLDDNHLDFYNKKDSLYNLALSTLDEIIDETYHYSRLSQVYLQKAELSLDHIFDLESAKDALENLSNIRGMEDSPELHYLQGRIYAAQNEYAMARLSLTKANKLSNSGELSEKTRYFLALTDFYSGDYEFAGIQLKSLGRQNTSYYANDALELRIWLQDGMSADTTGAELDAFASAVFKRLNGAITESTEDFLVFIQHPDYYSLKDDAMLFILTSPHTDDRTKLETLNKFIETYPITPNKEKLLWEQAKLTEKVMNNCTDPAGCISPDAKSAHDIYEELIISYPEGFFAPHARERLKKLSQIHS